MAKLNLRSNRKFRRLAAMLHLDSEAHVKGHLAELWEATWENGTPLIGDFDDIEHAARWPTANPEKYPRHAFAAALLLTGFVDCVAEGRLYFVHDWYEHLPEYMKRSISRRAKDDATVGQETFFLGVEGWVKRAASVGLVVDPFGFENAGEANVGQNASPAAGLTDHFGAEPGVRTRNGGLSSVAKRSRAERSEVSSSSTPCSPPPPSSPPDQLALRLWSDASDLIRLQLGRDNDGFSTFIAPLRALRIASATGGGCDTIQLGAPTQRLASIVAHDFAEPIRSALELVAERPMNFAVIPGEL